MRRAPLVRSLGEVGEVGEVGEIDDLIARLESVASDLDDVAFDRLREAVAEGEVARPKADRELMRARRAIEKAVMALRSLDDPAGRWQ